jgi:hypothetical protein
LKAPTFFVKRQEMNDMVKRLAAIAIGKPKMAQHATLFVVAPEGCIEAPVNEIFDRSKQAFSRRSLM